MSTGARVRVRLRGWGRGAVFTPKDLLDLGSRAAVDQALSRLARSGVIRRLTRGLYDFPRTSARLGVLTPMPSAVASALARETDSRLQVTGAQAANALGLSLQVPAQTVYLTDGPARKLKIGGRVITLKHASPKTMVAAGSRAGTVIQALRYLGPDAAQNVPDALNARLSPQDRRVLARTAFSVPAWMRPIVERLAEAR